MRVNYIRVSTESQNITRQEKEGFDRTFIDRCSGVIPFGERPGGEELLTFMKENPTTEVSVKSVDRLGRDTIDILQTIELFKSNNWKLVIEDLGMDSSSPFFPLMVSLLGTISNHEREMIKERTRQGITIAKELGKYKGRKKGTVDSRDKVLTKHKDVVKLLEKEVRISDISSITGKTRQTIYKVKKVM